MTIFTQKTFTRKTQMLKTSALGTIAALMMSVPLVAFAADAAPAATATKTSAGVPSCSSVMSKTKEFRDSSPEQIEGICKTNQNSPAYWSCMSKRVDKGQGFADAGMRCNKTTAKVTASR